MAVATTAPIPDKKKRTRSPAYPYVNLETAIARARQFHDQQKRNAANVSVAIKDWGFADGSSNGAQTIAALTSFGLLQDEGMGEKRKVRLTENALRILLDTRPDSKERADLIKQAALAPKVHQQLWEKWGTDLPSDAQLRHTLLLDWPTPFNENAVDGFIHEYKDTIAFAKLTESDKVASEDGVSGETERNGSPYIPKVGDYVQWESNGVLRLPESKKLREFSEDEKFAFVEGSYTGLPANELIRAKAPSNAPNPLASVTLDQRIPLPSKTHMQEFVVPLSDGSRAVFQWPTALSKEDVDDLRDSLKILERKISRSITEAVAKEKSNAKKDLKEN